MVTTGMKNVGLSLGTILLLQTALYTSGADLTLKAVDKEAPKEIGESIRQTLQPKAIQLLEGDKLVYELWFRTEVPLKSKPATPAKSLETVGETTVLGVATVGSGQRDYKDNEITPGLYTMRYSLQPQDGDHLGTSEFLYFAVLIPAKTDTTLEGIKSYRAMVKASGRATASEHPVVLSLRPPSSDKGESPQIAEPAPEHKSVQVKVPAKAPDSDQKESLVFELVFRGKYQH